VFAGGSIHVGDIQKDILRTALRILSEIPKTLFLVVEFYSNTRGFFARQFEMLSDGNEVPFTRVVVFCSVCLALGISCSGLLSGEKGPNVIGLGSLAGALVFWFVTAISIHPFLRLIGGKGNLYDTIRVFLICVAALHLIWIPTFGVLGKQSSLTGVIVRYDYLVTFGYGDWHDVFLGLSGRSQRFEKYIKEESPDKVGTVLAPVSETTGVATEQDWIRGHRGEAARSDRRIPISEVKGTPPEVTEFPILNSEGFFVKFYAYIMILYYITHFYFLSIGFSVVHRRPFSVLFALAIAGPITVLGAIWGVLWILGLALSDFGFALSGY
jgi:hypothetical protein